MATEKITVDVDADWAAELRAKGIDVVEHVERIVARTSPKPSNWAEENAEAIKVYNKKIEEEGIWSDGLRLF